MSFKLLAIRPLKGCDENFIKNLKKNYIYRFYNEYDYIYKVGKTKMSISKLQSSFRSGNELQNHTISSISYEQEVPESFYRENISVTAIVGKNGSGKSALLELLYAFIFNISKDNGILKFEDYKIDYNQIELELYYLLNNEYFKICHSYKTSTSVETMVYKSNENLEFLEYKNPTEIIFKFYSLVVNYSIYSLNSEVYGRWIQKLFHKNDAYQSPIVINPYRNEGNIDVNNEYNLAQARLILNHFVIKNDNLVEGIELDKVNYYLNILKTQLINQDSIEITNNLIIDDIISFLEINNFSGLNKFSQLLDIFFFEQKRSASLSALKLFLKSIGTDRAFYLKELSNNNYQAEISYLCFLYLFKKLKRISYNYYDYEKYNFLFDHTWNNDVFKDDAEKFKINFREKIGLKQGVKNIDFSKDKIELNKSFRGFVKNNSIFITLYNLIGSKVELETNKVLQSFIVEKDFDLDNVIDLIFDDFTHIIDLYRKELLIKYILDLNNDDTHIAFKYRQALNYFRDNIFNNLEIKPVTDEYTDKIPGLYNIIIDQNLLAKSEIHSIPISFFKPEILVKKSGNIYPFNRLSSGEQQMIHSLLNITYHLFNIVSVKRNKQKKKYDNVNIIFDEVELYFHPEFQRIFIYNLINSLLYFEQFKLKFNIIFSTHSPFILSDIPTQNIMKLEEGISLKDSDGYNSFGANIHDLLADEFFLKGNTVGAFANLKISKILEFLFTKTKIRELKNNVDNDIFSKSLRKEMSKEIAILEIKLKNNIIYSQDQVLHVAELIGEPLIKNKIEEMARQVFNH